MTAHRLGTSISETANLIVCSQTAVVDTHQKWKNDGEAVSRRGGVGRPRLTKECGRLMLSRLLTQNRWLAVAQLTADYNAG